MTLQDFVGLLFAIAVFLILLYVCYEGSSHLP